MQGRFLHEIFIFYDSLHVSLVVSLKGKVVLIRLSTFQRSLKSELHSLVMLMATRIFADLFFHLRLTPTCMALN